jgi:hypothetical protein
VLTKKDKEEEEVVGSLGFFYVITFNVPTR